MLIENFNHTIDIWIKALEAYDFTQLCAKPAPKSWSLGQMYRHLINETTYYIDQIEICTTNNAYATEEASANAKIMFINNAFADEIIEGNASNAYIPQPDSKAQLLNDLIQLKKTMNEVVNKIATSPFNGKTKHPGLNYFSAKDWLQFAEMHLRHHFRQKERIDRFLEVHTK